MRTTDDTFDVGNFFTHIREPFVVQDVFTYFQSREECKPFWKFFWVFPKWRMINIVAIAEESEVYNNG